MAITAITSELLTLNTRSADLPFIAGGGSANAIVATAAADGWEISPASGEQFDERTVLILGSDGSGGTCTFNAGDRYPAQRADLGTLVITLAANDGRVVAVEMSRFMKNTGIVVCIPSTTGLVMTAVTLPKAA
tara:strand:+ start:297 stop:695 length:399 start_codon:yes stop_codon:yes gene_type:complete